MFFYEVKGHMQKLSSFGLIVKKILAKESLWLLINVGALSTATIRNKFVTLRMFKNSN